MSPHAKSGEYLRSREKASQVKRRVGQTADNCFTGTTAADQLRLGGAPASQPAFMRAYVTVWCVIGRCPAKHLALP